MAENAFKLTPKQEELNRLLAGLAMYILAYGGARSAKTFALCRAIVVRALRAPGSRHLIARYRFNAVTRSRRCADLGTERTFPPSAAGGNQQAPPRGRGGVLRLI